MHWDMVKGSYLSAQKLHLNLSLINGKCFDLGKGLGKALKMTT